MFRTEGAAPAGLLHGVDFVLGEEAVAVRVEGVKHAQQHVVHVRLHTRTTVSQDC